MFVLLSVLLSACAPNTPNSGGITREEYDATKAAKPTLTQVPYLSDISVKSEESHEFSATEKVYELQQDVALPQGWGWQTEGNKSEKLKLTLDNAVDFQFAYSNLRDAVSLIKPGSDIPDEAAEAYYKAWEVKFSYKGSKYEIYVLCEDGVASPVTWKLSFTKDGVAQ